MGTGIFSIGISGVTAAQMGLLATEHNVVNANTPGYSRQRTIQATNISVNTAAGSLGQGVRVRTVERMYDSFLTGQVSSAQTKASELDAFYSQITQIDSLLADPGAGLSPALQDFFSAVQKVAADPSLLPARQSMISAAETLTSRFQAIDARLTDLSTQVNQRIEGAIAEINSFASQIADVNQRISLAQAAYGQPANDLLDQRDQLVADMNKLIKVSTITNADGSYNLFIGSGQQLVVGNQVIEMTATPSVSDPTRVAVGLKTAGGVQELPESLLQGGAIGGYLRFRSESLGKSSSELGRMAASLALTFNAQHGLGQDLLGRIQGEVGFVGNFFDTPKPNIVTNSLNLGAANVTAAFTAPVAPQSPTYAGNFYTNLTTSNYRLEFGAAGAYTVTRLSDNAVVGAGAGAGSVSFDGVTLNIAAVGASGDKFEIQPNQVAARDIRVSSQISADPRLIAAAAPVTVSPNIVNSGNFTITQGKMGTGYSLASLPVSLITTATTLNGVPGTWTAVYTNGATATSTGNIPLTNAGATLKSFAFSGMVFETKGTPPFGDRFGIGRNTNGVGDGRNAALFSQLQTQNTMVGGTATYQGAYGRMVADNGIRTREAKIQMDSQEAALKFAQETRDALSGVNLDEEAANMLKFQRAYQASAKILEVGNTLFDTILALR